MVGLADMARGMMESIRPLKYGAGSGSGNGGGGY